MMNDPYGHIVDHFCLTADPGVADRRNGSREQRQGLGTSS